MTFSIGDYVTVNERLRAALEKYPDLRVMEKPPKMIEAGGKMFIEVGMTVHRDASDTMPMIGHAWEEYPGLTPYTKGSEAANASTSCLGRILGFMGFGINKSIATREDVAHREPQQTPRQAFRAAVPVVAPAVYPNGAVVPDPFTGEQQTTATYPPGDASKGQMGMIRALGRARDVMSNKALFGAISTIIGRHIGALDDLSKREASQVIESWQTPVIQDSAGEVPDELSEQPF